MNKKPSSTTTTNPEISRMSVRQPSLRLLGADRYRHLTRLGLHTLHDLLDYEPVRSARTLAAVARGLIAKPQLANLVKEEFTRKDSAEAISWPVTALHNLTDEEARILAALGINTINDLAQLAKEADEAVLAALADNDFHERPSAPAQLLPGMLGSVASSVRFTTFIRDVELRQLQINVNESCIVQLPISSGLKYPGSLVEIFQNQTCPVLYLGYMGDHRQRWINLGTHLGEVVHSLSLAPGESRNIALVNWRRRQLTALEERTTTSEHLTATFVQNRALEEITSAVAREHQSGHTQTEANTAVTATSFVGAGAVIGGVAVGATGAVVGGIIGSTVPGVGTTMGAVAGGAVGAAAGAAAGVAAGGLVYSASQALGTIEADTEGDREILADVQQRISLSTSQKASAVRSLWSTVVVEDSQAEGVDAQTSNITNYNHMHTLNIEYYEVLQHYLVQIELERVHPILFLPFTFFDFTHFRFIRDYWDAVRLHIDDDGLRAQGDAYFVTEGVPEVPDLLPVPPLPVPPEAEQAPTLKNLRIDVLFKSLPFNTNIGLDVMRGNVEISGSEQENGVPADDLDGYDWGTRYTFDDIADAHEITAVNLSRNQFISTDIKYRIRVRSGRLVSDDHLLENIAGQVIASNRTISASSQNQTFAISWRPAAGFQAENSQTLAEFNRKKTERDAIIAENQRRMAAYEALVENIQRFQERLQRLILRRRHFFTRVILNAIEPEEITQVLESLKIGHADAGNPDFGIPLSAVVHTIPLGMTTGAFVLKLKRLDKERLRQLAQRVGMDKEVEDLITLLRYADQTLAFFEDAKRKEAMTQTDHVYVPTGGLFAEAILGRANSAEYLDMERYFNWQDSPIPHQAPAIQPVGTESRFQRGEVSVNVPEGNLQVINPVNLPEPTGLHGVLAAIQNPNLFRDMSKAAELAGIINSLSTLAGQMGQAASEMTGQAAQQALQAATEVGEAAAGIAQSMMSQAFTQAGGAFNTLTSQGAALNQAAKIDAANAASPSGSGSETPGATGTPTPPSPSTGGNPPSTGGGPSLQEETFRDFLGGADNGVTFATFTPDSGESTGVANVRGTGTFTSAVRSLTEEFPALDFRITEPSPRNCCAIFPGGVMGFFQTNYLDLSQVPGHHFGSSGFFPDDSVGHVYTLRGGFVDLGHVRDLADYARFLTVRALELQRDGGVVPLMAEGGARRLRVVAQQNEVPDLELAALIGMRAAYDCAIWHEIVTWFTNIRHSSFSPEDNFSNLMGAMLGASACMSRGRDYDTSIDELLVNQLDTLEVLSAAEAREAVDQVAGLWFDKGNDLTAALLGDANANQILLRRNMVAQPTVTPWLVTDLHGLRFNIPDPVAGPGVERTIQFAPVSPKPTAASLTLPQSTSRGKRLAEAYAFEIEVDTSVIASSVLPAGRRSITSVNFDECVQKVRSEVLALFPGGDKPIE